MTAAIGFIGFLAIMAFGVAQMYVGFIGIEYELGVGWAWGALGLALALRLTLPITVGAFFGAMNVLGWHWVWAALFALPGLVFVVPGILSAVLSLAKGK